MRIALHTQHVHKAFWKLKGSFDETIHISLEMVGLAIPWLVHENTLGLLTSVIQSFNFTQNFSWRVNVPDHDGGRPKQINAWFLYTHKVYL